MTTPIEKILELDTRLFLQGPTHNSKNISVTNLVSPCLKRVKYDKEVGATYKPNMHMIIGTAIHDLLEKNTSKFKTKYNITTEVYSKYYIHDDTKDDYITGRIDGILWIDEDKYVIFDYKIVEKIPAAPPMRYIEQVNIYNEMVKQMAPNSTLYEEGLYLIYVNYNGDIRLTKAPVMSNVKDLIQIKYNFIKNWDKMIQEGQLDIPLVPPYICKECPYVQQCLGYNVK